MWLILVVSAAVLLTGGLLLVATQQGDETPSSPNPSVPTNPPDTPHSTDQQISWSTTATDYRDNPRGQKLTFLCPSNGTPETVYGTEVYTDDSSICSAAVHAGTISFEEGGKVTIILREGQAQYSGSARNGVESQDWNSEWDGSFQILTADSERRPYIPTISWSQTASDYSDQIGKKFSFKCPPSGTAASAWGTDRYTDDSSICTAGVHAGEITLQDGGTVSIVISDGASAFQGSYRNGIESSDWGEWPRGFYFVD
ncbi:LCCL domain-containing protein [Streptomyces sp. NPDC018833]|uniref:LCCL domain-containing protein n=1 Tax=Streptomyces sp. NPDC018833 TaxID=3365053 RepID=UPI00379152DA